MSCHVTIHLFSQLFPAMQQYCTRQISTADTASQAAFHCTAGLTVDSPISFGTSHQERQHLLAAKLPHILPLDRLGKSYQSSFHPSIHERRGNVPAIQPLNHSMRYCGQNKLKGKTCSRAVLYSGVGGSSLARCSSGAAASPFVGRRQLRSGASFCRGNIPGATVGIRRMEKCKGLSCPLGCGLIRSTGFLHTPDITPQTQRTLLSCR